MYQRLLKIDPQKTHSILLLGPRGTGKTSWINAHFHDALYLDLLHTETYLALAANPSRLEKMVPQKFTQWIVIDEVQKIPELLNEVHRLIEHKRFKFILTGSSARSLRKRGVNLLAGRALSYQMHPLTAIELGKDFSLEKALTVGLLPATTSMQDPKHYLSTYITTYLKEEILQEGINRNAGEFTRFLETASFSQGNVLNLSNIARESAIDRKTVANYFNIVEDILIGLRLLPFTKHAKRRVTQHPKFYFFDVGVYRHIRPMGPLDTPAEAEGPGLETLFLQHLRAYNDYYQLNYQFYYWRTSNGLEVDFVAYGEKGLIAFEIKRKRHIHSNDLSGLRAFVHDYPIAKLYLIYGGEHELHEGNVTILPIAAALKKLPALLSLN